MDERPASSKTNLKTEQARTPKRSIWWDSRWRPFIVLCYVPSCGVVILTVIHSRLREDMTVCFECIVEPRALYLYPEYHVKIVKLTRPVQTATGGPCTYRSLPDTGARIICLTMLSVAQNGSESLRLVWRVVGSELGRIIPLFCWKSWDKPC